MYTSFAARRVVLALTGLAAVPALLLTSACTDGGTTAARPVAVTAPASPAARPVAVPAVASTAAHSTTAHTITATGLRGDLYYVTADGALVRLTPNGLRTVLPTGGDTATVSPDGARLAYLDGDRLMVTDRDGHHRRVVRAGLSGEGFEPVWSADSRSVLTAVSRGDRNVIGTVDVTTGRFAPLAHQPADAVHPLRAYGNGRLAFSTGECRVGTADADGGHATLLPVLGVEGRTNPRFRRSCDPYSVSPDGRLVALDEHTGAQPDGDIARNLRANTVVDVRTAAPLTLPVAGRMSAAFYLPDGRLLTRTTAGRTTTLTLLNADRTVAARITEPRAAASLDLLAFIPR